MRVLQLTSDWKWTGPAEPMLRLAQAQRKAGLEVWLGCPRAPEEARDSLPARAAAAGLEPALWLDPARGVRLLRDAGDAARLRHLLEERGVDVVHCWHTRDHVLALRAAGRRDHLAVVRSYRLAQAIPRTPWNRWLFGRRTAGLLCVSPRTAVRNTAIRAGRPVAGAFGAVDLERFRPAPPDPELRRALGLAPEHRVLGIVARVQAHRRFDLLLDAARRLFERDPRARLLVVGRGTRRAELAEEPARRLGIADRVFFAGYRAGDYAEVLRCMDLFTFLVPGSDGTCRALLEAAACGIPAVTSRRGALPEIVQDGETGRVVDEDPEALAAAWGGLLGDPEARERMGGAARQRAEQLFAPERLAAEVAELYERARA